MSSTRHSLSEIRTRQLVRPLRPSDMAPQSRQLRIHGIQPSPSALEDKARRRQRAAYKAPATGATQHRKNSAPEKRKAKARPGVESTIERKANTITDRG